MTSQYGHEVLLGIDIGTTGAKCTCYDVQGKPVASAYQEYAMLCPRPGWAEEDPRVWWQAVQCNIRQCLAQGSVRAEAVAAVGVSCTNSILPLDATGEPLYNAILQIDQRAAHEVAWIEEHLGARRIFDVTGNRIARGTFSLPTLLWYMHHRPDIVEKTHTFVVPSGFIVHRLTGEFSINTSRMGFTLLSNIRQGTWDADIIRDAGLPAEKLPTPCEATQIVGRVTRQAAALTGLRAGTPVVGGAMDTVAAAVGAAAVNPGDAFLAMGTCGRLCHCSAQPEFDDRLMNCRHAVPGQWLNVEATNASGVSLRWFRDVFGGALAAKAQQEGRSVYAAIDALAAESSPGANGLVYLPYLSGERCPIWDPDARGVFFGLHLGTSYGDMARAIMEGVAFSIRQGMEIVLERTALSGYLPLGGGIGSSPIWSQIFADVLERPLVRLSIFETETLGGAAMAAAGVGLEPDLGAMGRAAVGNSPVLEPDPKHVGIYREYFDIYKNVYVHLREDFQRLRKARALLPHAAE